MPSTYFNLKSVLSYCSVTLTNTTVHFLPSGTALASNGLDICRLRRCAICGGLHVACEAHRAKLAWCMGRGAWRRIRSYIPDSLYDTVLTAVPCQIGTEASVICMRYQIQQLLSMFQLRIGNVQLALHLLGLDARLQVAITRNCPLR